MEEFFSQAKRGGVAIGGTLWSAFSLNQWVAVATGAYVVLQFAYLVRKWWREEQDWQAKSKETR